MYCASGGSAIGPPWQITITSSRTDLAASAISWMSRTHSSSVLELFAPIVPPVVTPMWATTRSAPASAIQRASCGLKTYGVVRRSISRARRITSTSSL